MKRKEGLSSYNPVHLEAVSQAASERLKALIRIADIHKKTETQKHPRCMECGMTYPCRTRQIALGEPIQRPATVGELP